MTATWYYRPWSGKPLSRLWSGSMAASMRRRRGSRNRPGHRFGRRHDPGGDPMAGPRSRAFMARDLVDSCGPAEPGIGRGRSLQKNRKTKIPPNPPLKKGGGIWGIASKVPRCQRGILGSSVRLGSCMVATGKQRQKNFTRGTFFP
jgi:hypothetical protein